MGSEQAKVCTCPHCTMESDGACSTKDARAASQHGPAGNPFPPQAEVVRESRPELLTPPREYSTPCPEVYVIQIDHGGGFWANSCCGKDAAEVIMKRNSGNARVWRLPSESPATKCPHPAKQLCNVVDPGGSTERLSCGLCGATMPSPATKRGEEIPCHRCRYMTFSGSICNKCGAITIKEHACSGGSQGGGGGHDAGSQRAADAPATTVGGSSLIGDSSSRPADPSKSSCASGVQRADAVASNPPAWATPQILAACKPGERLFKDCYVGIRAFPSGQYWVDGRPKGFTICSLQEAEAGCSESYTIPTPPPDKPKPDDAEEVADTAILHYESHTGRNTYCRGVLVGWVAAAIRADRQKHAGTRAVLANPTPEQAAAILSTSNSGPITTMPGYNSIPPDLAGKVRELCEYIRDVFVPGGEAHTLAREVLAMMEAK